MTGEPAAPPLSRLYPIGLKVGGRRCLVVGSGPLARRKAEELLECGALVTVVDTEHAVTPAAAEVVEGPTLSRRAFIPADLDGVFLVVAAIADERVQQLVARSAAERGIPCNVVDVNDLCTFYAPAVLRLGSVTISVATEGMFPMLAVAIRDRIATTLGDAIGPALERLNEGRELARARFPDDPDARRAALQRLLSGPAFNSILDGRLAEFEEHWASWKTEIASQV